MTKEEIRKSPGENPDDEWIVIEHFPIRYRAALQLLLKNTHNQLFVIMACDGDKFRVAYAHRPDALEILYQSTNETHGLSMRTWIDENFRNGESDNDKRRNQKADPEER